MKQSDSDADHQATTSQYESLADLTPHENHDPAWYTPARLLVAFCIVSFLVYLDRGIIASNGVNGDKDSRTGIQVRTNFQRGANDCPKRCFCCFSGGLET